MSLTHQTTTRLTVEGAAEYIGVSKSFLDKQRITGSGPVYLKIGRLIAYDVADIDDWLRSRRRTSTSANAEAA